MVSQLEVSPPRQEVMNEHAQSACSTLTSLRHLTFEWHEQVLEGPEGKLLMQRGS